MKIKTFFTILLPVMLSVIFAGCVSAGGTVTDNTITESGPGLSLMEAIEQSAQKAADDLPQRSRVVVMAFETGNDNFSDYIIQELTGSLIDSGIEVADRRNLDYVYKELDFQMSGDVSDESAKSIGKFLAADFVITGQLINVGNIYRYRITAINVEEAISGSSARFDVRNDNEMRQMVTALTNNQIKVDTAQYGVSESTPQSAGAFLDRGIQSAMCGAYDLAIEDFSEALRINPDLTAAYMLRGRAYEASVLTIFSVDANFSEITTISTGGQATAEQIIIIDKAIADYNQAVRLDPNYAVAYKSRGNAYADKGEFNLAIADFNRAIMLDPNYAVAYSNRGITYADMGDDNRAIADYNQAIRLHPDYADAYFNRGLSYLNLEDFGRAITDFTHSLRFNPQDVYSLLQRGIAYYERDSRGDLNRALDDLNQAIRLNSNLVDAFIYRSLVYYARNNRGDHALAIADLEMALRIDPQNADAKEILNEIR